MDDRSLRLTVAKISQTCHLYSFIFKSVVRGSVVTLFHSKLERAAG